MKQLMVLGLSALALSFIAVVPAGAGAETTICRMDYDLKSWSAFYKKASGTGTITCDNNQTATVKLSAKGGGLTAGRSVVRDGHGTFSEVANIKELFGSYINGSAAAGVGKSSEAGVMTKGEVSLALAGNGTGVELGVSFGKFTITRR